MEFLPINEKYRKKSKEIDDINDLLTKFSEKVARIKNEEINKSIETFRLNYASYYSKLAGLKRFSIPVFGKISSGKSTLLNYILNLHGYLEVNSTITTKFICIIRHNPNLTDGPKIYNVTVTERGEYIKDGKKIKLWNFEKKGDELGKDIKEIIEKRNHENNKLESRDSNWEKYFMLLETDIPLFHDFNYIFSELFEFLDVPGLNEFTGNEEVNNQFYYKELVPFFFYNVGFSLYIFDAEKYVGEDSISILNNIKKLYYDNDKYEQTNSIFILNKIDKINNKKEEIENLKKILDKNIKGSFIGLSGLLLYLKRFKYKSFSDYLFCIIEEFNNPEKNSFEEYIIQIMSKDFKTDIEENLDINDDATIPEDQKKILEDINNKATSKGLIGKLSIENYIYYKDIFEKLAINKKEDLGEEHENFEKLIIQSFNNTINDYLENFKDNNLLDKLLIELGITKEDLKKEEIKKDIKFSIEEPFEFINSLKDIIDSLAKLDNDDYIKELPKEYQETLKVMNQNQIRIPLLGEYSSGKSSLLNSLIGHNFNVLPVGPQVCTNIALVIKYTNKNENISLFHTFLEKTPKDIYIFHSEETPLAKGQKTVNSVLNLLNELYDTSKYEEAYQNKVLGFVKNLDQIKEEYRVYNINILIKLLKKEISIDSITDTQAQNNLKTLIPSSSGKIKENKDFFKRAFFLLNIPIEAYDIMNLPDNMKENIELIDFPGLDSINNSFRMHVLEPLLEFSNGFIFVNKGDSINEEGKAQILSEIIRKIQGRKYDFTFKSCLFVLNRCDETEIDIKECEKKYGKMFEIEKKEKSWNELMIISKKIKDSNNVNVTKFSNKFYSDFKLFKNRIDDFDKYIEEYEKKIDKKYEGKKYLLYLRKRVHDDVVDISIEKYKNFKQTTDDMTTYQKRFETFLKEDDRNKSIIDDIIKMYLFLKSSTEDSKFYVKSNAKDFFDKFKAQILISQEFYKNNLKKILVEYLLTLNKIFNNINLKSLFDKIDLKFRKDDFTQALNNLNKKLIEKKEEFKKIIDSKLNLMEKEYDQLIKDFKDGNFRSYKESIENTSKNIIQIKKDLENNVNIEFENFQRDLKSLEKELKFEEILKELELEVDVNESDPEAFDSVGKAEREFFSGVGEIATKVGGYAGGTLSALALVVIAGLIHGGFAIYRQFTKKGSYIKFIENEKKEIIHSIIHFEENVDNACDKCKNQLEIGIKNFEKIIFSKSEGIKKNKGEWKKLYNLFKKRLRLAFEIK